MGADDPQRCGRRCIVGDAPGDERPVADGEAGSGTSPHGSCRAHRLEPGGDEPWRALVATACHGLGEPSRYAMRSSSSALTAPYSPAGRPEPRRWAISLIDTIERSALRRGRDPADRPCSSGRRSPRRCGGAQHVGEVAVDHAAVADDRDPLAGVVGDDALDAVERPGRGSRPRSRRRATRRGAAPASGGRWWPAAPRSARTSWRVRSYSAMSSDTAIGRPWASATGCAVSSARAHRAGVDGGDLLVGQVLAEQLGLGDADLGQLGVGGALVDLAADRQGMADQQQLHHRVDKHL